MMKMKTKMLAVVRIRGSVNAKEGVKRTLKYLNLTRPNHCTILPETPTVKGMLQKVKDYVTWGEIDEKTLKKLVKERGRLKGDKKVPEENVDDIVKLIMEKGIKESGINVVFRLTPPRKGYERKGVKKPFTVGGALGYRGKEINKLLEKMI